MEPTRVSVPRTARQGETIQIKTLISHPMESGQRKNEATGVPIPRQIINKFVCTYNGQEVFRADWYPAMAANPYLTFYVVATASGRLDFTWTDDAGQVYTQSATITVH